MTIEGIAFFFSLGIIFSRNYVNHVKPFKIKPHLGGDNFKDIFSFDLLNPEDFYILLV